MGNLNDTFQVVLDEKESLEACIQKGPFDRAHSALEQKSYELSTARELAEGRIAFGPKSAISEREFVVAECFVYLPDGRILVVSRHDSPILMTPGRATDAHRGKEEFYLNDKWVDYLLKQAHEDPRKALETRVLLLHRKDIKFMRTDSLGKYPLGYFLWGDLAEPYGNLVRSQGTKEVPVYTLPVKITKEMRPFARPLRISNLMDASRLNAAYLDLNKRGNYLCGLRHTQVYRSKGAVHVILK